MSEIVMGSINLTQDLMAPQLSENFDAAINYSAQEMAEQLKQVEEQSLLDWVWGALMGDFNEDRSIGQVLVDTVLGVIPFVDQALDLRDIIACGYLYYKAETDPKLQEDERKEKKHQVAISSVLTLIGCIPEVGSIVKGILRIIFVVMKRLVGQPISVILQKAWEPIKAFLTHQKIKDNFFKNFSLKQLLERVGEWMRVAKQMVNSGIEKLKASFKQVFEYFNELYSDTVESWFVSKIVSDEVIAWIKNAYTIIHRMASKLDEIIEAGNATVRRIVHETEEFIIKKLMPKISWY